MDFVSLLGKEDLATVSGHAPEPCVRVLSSSCPPGVRFLSSSRSRGVLLMSFSCLPGVFFLSSWCLQLFPKQFAVGVPLRKYWPQSLATPLNLVSRWCPPVALFLSSPVPPSCPLGVLLLFFGRTGKPCVLLLFPKQFTLSLSSPGFVCSVGRAALSGFVCPAWLGLVRVCLSCLSTLSALFPQPCLGLVGCWATRLFLYPPLCPGMWL